MNARYCPTGEMVRDVLHAAVDAIRALDRRFTRADASVAVEARRMAEGLFGDYMTANMLALGVAYQAASCPSRRAPSRRPSG